MTWWKESSYWKWWQDDDAEVVPSSAAAGSWEGGTSSSATETWDWTDPGPNTPGAWREEVPRRGRGGRKGSAQTPGKGELLGYRWRFNPWTGKEFWSEKRAKVLPPGRTPHRSGQFHPAATWLKWPSWPTNPERSRASRACCGQSMVATTPEMM